jgi:UTRA domain/Carboxypeptidase regulatory-like domain
VFLSFGGVAADAEVAQALHLTLGAKAFCLCRVRLADSVPMGVENSFLPLALYPGLLESFDPRKSLYRALTERYGIRMLAADEVVETALATSEQAQLLGIKRNAAVFHLTRVSYAQNARPVEFVRSIYRGDRWKIVSHLFASHQTADGRTATRKPLAAITKGETLPLHSESRSTGRYSSSQRSGQSQKQTGGLMKRKNHSVLVAMIISFAVLLAAQEITGDVRGVVKDTTGALIAGAKVSVTNTDRNVAIRTITTGPDGSYIAPYLPVGHYRVAVEVQGFKKLVVNDIVLNVNDHRIVDAQLQVGGADQIVNVQESPVGVDLETAQAAGLINGTQIRELSVLSRNFIQLVTLQPGVSSDMATDQLYVGASNPTGLSNQINLSINGSRPSQNSFLIDGADDMQRGADLRLLAYPSVDSIAEFRPRLRMSSRSCGCRRQTMKAPSNSRSGCERIKTRNTFRTISLSSGVSK